MSVNLDALLKHDLMLSAKATRTALAVVTIDGKEELTEIDLKQVGILGKISLWWNNSLKKETITNFVSKNYEQWTAEIGADQKKMVLFETQCARLARKMDIWFVHRPKWNLNVTLEYPDPVTDKLQSVEVPLGFDRLSTLNGILENMKKRRITIHTAGVQSTPKFESIYDTIRFSGEHAGKPLNSTFLSEKDKGGDRSCKITFSDLNKGKLLTQASKHAAIQSQRVYRENYYYHPGVYHNNNDGLAFATGALLGAMASVAGRRHCRR